MKVRVGSGCGHDGYDSCEGLKVIVVAVVMVSGIAVMVKAGCSGCGHGVCDSCGDEGKSWYDGCVVMVNVVTWL